MVAMQPSGNFRTSPAWQLNQRDIAFFAEQLRRIAGGTNQLRAAAGIQLQIVERRAGRNQLNRQRIAGKNVRAFAGQNRHTDLKSNGLKDIALFSVRIMEKRQQRRAVRIIFDGGNPRWDSGFIAPEVDHAVLPLMAAAAMPAGDFAVRVTSTGTLARFG